VCDNLPGTDHDAVQFTFSILPPKQCPVYRYLYNYKKADFNKFRETLSSVPWEIAESSDIDSWWENWKDLFFAAVSTDIPVVRWRRSKMKCWLSLATIKATKQKRIVYRKLKHKPSDCLAHKYKSLRNLVRRLTRKDYQIYAEKLSSSLSSDQKVFWNWVNKVKCCRHPVPPIQADGLLLLSHCDKAQHFNTYFSSVFTIEDTTSLDQLYEELNVHDSPVLLDHVKTSIEEVYDLLSSLKVNKACGPDLICGRLLKEGAAEFLLH